MKVQAMIILRTVAPNLVFWSVVWQLHNRPAIMSARWADLCRNTRSLAGWNIQGTHGNRGQIASAITITASAFPGESRHDAS